MYPDPRNIGNESEEQPVPTGVCTYTHPSYMYIHEDVGFGGPFYNSSQSIHDSINCHIIFLIRIRMCKTLLHFKHFKI